MRNHKLSVSKQNRLQSRGFLIVMLMLSCIVAKATNKKSFYYQSHLDQYGHPVFSQSTVTEDSEAKSHDNDKGDEYSASTNRKLELEQPVLWLATPKVKIALKQRTSSNKQSSRHDSNDSPNSPLNHCQSIKQQIEQLNQALSKKQAAKDFDQQKNRLKQLRWSLLNKC